MGILNITPDSFYDRGRFFDRDRALERAVEMAEEGADIIDVGGEKAGPGDPVSVQIEIERVAPVIERIRAELPVVVSVDTFKSEVARVAVAAGAAIVNSIGGMEDPEMRRVAAESGAAAVVMHIQGRPRVANPSPVYGNVVDEVVAFLRRRTQECLDAGISADRLVIDPGPGFGKTSAHDIALLRALERFTLLPYPVLLAVSRKTFLGDLLGTDAGERLEGSLAVAAWGVMRGVRIIRTHDVRATKRVVAMTEAVLQTPLEGPGA
ncbi:MAG TPA: dihydropteroate synthase [Chloroflexota bacterium]|nr:dihydropteroate synthase [Chloroflexota bacterium]